MSGSKKSRRQLVDFIDERGAVVARKTAARLRAEMPELRKVKSADIQARVRSILAALREAVSRPDVESWRSVLDPYAGEMVERGVPLGRAVRNGVMLRRVFRGELVRWHGSQLSAQRTADVETAEAFFDHFLRDLALAYERHAERLLRESEQRHRSFFEGMIFPAFLADTDGCILEVNPAMRRFIGEARCKPAGEHLTDFLLAGRADAGDVERFWRRLRGRRKAERMPLAFHCPEDGERHIEISASFRSDTAGEEVGIQGFFQEITRRVRSERKVEEQTRTLEGIFDRAPIGMLYVDGEQIIRGINDEFLRNVGTPREGMRARRKAALGKHYLERLEEILDQYEDPEAYRHFVRKALSSPRKRHATELLLRNNEIVLMHSAPVGLGAGRPSGRIFISQNITSRRQLEKLRDELTHMIVHDLKNPLSAISMANSNLRQFMAAEERERLGTQLDVIARGCANMMRMIMNLLDISRMEEDKLELQPEALDPGALLEELRPDLEALGAGRRLEFPRRRRQPGLRADPGLVRRILENLFSNAVKHTRPGGEIRIDLGRSGRYFEFHVEDDGEGIPEASQQRIFEKFGQAAERRSGRKTDTGLGLTFCKLAAEAHGGEIRLRSAPGQGSRFTLRLPLED